MEFEFTVGKTDRHVVRFKYSRMTNTVRIYVDGNPAKKDAFRIWIPASRHYELEVGQAERHKVEIETSIPRLGAKFRNPKCSVIVDREFIREY